MVQLSYSKDRLTHLRHLQVLNRAQNVKLIVELTLIPINSAASLSTDTARIAFPIFVFLTINCKATIKARETI